MNALEHYFADLVKETVAKLGVGASAMTFNVPPKTVERLLCRDGDAGGKIGDFHILPSIKEKVFSQREKKETDGEAAWLTELRRQVSAFAFGGLSFVTAGDLFVFTVSADAVRTIADLPKTKRDDFVTALVSLCRTPTAGKEDVLSLFRSYAPEVRTARGDGDEFDEAFFAPNFDPFVYCFHFDVDGAHYHRLLPSDFADLYPALAPALLP